MSELLKRNEKIAMAHAACDCPPAYGVAMCCAIVALPTLTFIPVGETCLVQLPEAFICPRHEIMEW